MSRSLILFTIILAVFAAISFNPYTSRLDMGLNLDLMSKVVERRIEENPGSFELRTLLATLFYETEKWQAARGEYEKTLELEYNQPNALNNLAWLLLTCPDTSIHNPKKALRLAEDAIKLSREAHIFDTLAEAYLANLKFKEAYEASRLAWRTARVNQKYFQEQLQKMKRAYELKRKSTKI